MSYPHQLKANKLDRLTDFLGAAPSIMRHALDPKIITAGYVENGFLDRVHRRFPDVDQIIATVRRPILQEELDLFNKNFSAMYHQMGTKGRLTDEYLIGELGFPADVNGQGEVVMRGEDVHLSHQRAQNLSHETLVQKRAAAAKAQRLRAEEEHREARDLRVRMLKEERAACMVLTQKMNYRSSHRVRVEPAAPQRRRSSTSHNSAFKAAHALPCELSDATLEDLDRLSVPQMKAIIHARLYSTEKKDYGSAPWPNKKGTVKSAQQEEHSMLWLLNQVKTLPIKLRVDPPESGGIAASSST